MNIEQNDKQQDTVLHSVSSPIELVKKDFDTEYLPKLFDEIKQKVVFGNSLNKKLPKDVNKPVINYKLFDINKTKYSYLSYERKGTTNITFQKVLNSIPYMVKPYFKIFNNLCLYTTFN